MWWLCLIKLLEKDVLLYTKVGDAVSSSAILWHTSTQRDAERTHALDELAALNQEMGLYEH